jgi:hypothetical protein
MESRFRLFIVAIKPTACQSGTDLFYKVRDCLLSEIKKEGYKEMLEFFALIRNTIHNNGVYFNKNKTLRYRGKEYNFEYGKITDYGNPYELLFYKITPDIGLCLKEVWLV